LLEADRRPISRRAVATHPSRAAESECSVGVVDGVRSANMTADDIAERPAHANRSDRIDARPGVLAG